MKPTTIKVEGMQCPKCKHKWVLRTKNPKECPKCKKRLYTFKKMRAIKKEFATPEQIQKEFEKIIKT